MTSVFASSSPLTQPQAAPRSPKSPFEHQNSKQPTESKSPVQKAIASPRTSAVNSPLATSVASAASRSPLNSAVKLVQPIVSPDLSTTQNGVAVQQQSPTGQPAVAPHASIATTDSMPPLSQISAAQTATSQVDSVAEHATQPHSVIDSSVATQSPKPGPSVLASASPLTGASHPPPASPSRQAKLSLSPHSQSAAASDAGDEPMPDASLEANAAAPDSAPKPAADTRVLPPSTFLAWLTPLQAKAESKKMKGYRWLPIEPAATMLQSHASAHAPLSETKRIRKPKVEFEPNEAGAAQPATPTGSSSHRNSIAGAQAAGYSSKRQSVSNKAPANQRRKSGQNGSMPPPPPPHRNDSHSPSSKRQSVSGHGRGSTSQKTGRASASGNKRKSMSGHANQASATNSGRTTPAQDYFDFSADKEVKEKEEKIRSLEAKLEMHRRDLEQSQPSNGHAQTQFSQATSLQAAPSQAARQSSAQQFQRTPAPKQQRQTSATGGSSAKRQRTTPSATPVPRQRASAKRQDEMDYAPVYPNSSASYLSANAAVPSGVTTKRGRQIKIPASNFIHEPVNLSNGMKRCLTLVTQLINAKAQRGVFNEPVNHSDSEKPFYAADYCRLISPGTPIDLTLIRHKVSLDEYADSIDAFAADVRMVFANAKAFNPPTDWIHQQAVELGQTFETDLVQMIDKLNRPAPPRKSLASQAVGYMPLGQVESGADITGLRERLESLEQQLVVEKRKGNATAAGGSKRRRAADDDDSAEEPPEDYASEEDIEEDEEPAYTKSKKSTGSNKRQSSGTVVARRAPQPKANHAAAAALRLSTPLSQREKILLRGDILSMPPEHITHIMRIIETFGEPEERQENADEIELDIDKMNIRTLRELQSFVKRTIAQSTNAATRQQPQQEAMHESAQVALPGAEPLSRKYSSSEESDSEPEGDKHASTFQGEDI